MKSLLFISLISLFSILFALENKEITIATESWDGATNEDGTGLYWDVMKRVYEPLGYTIIKKHTSFKGSEDMLKKGQADMHLGAYKNENDFALYPKYYFDQDIIVAVVRMDVFDEWKGKKSLKGLKVGWLRGYHFDKYMGIKTRNEEFSSRHNAFKLLNNEHLDAFIDVRRLLRPYLSKKNIDMEDLTQKIILQLKVYPAFAKTKFGEELKKVWDKQMKKLIKKEEFKELYFNSEYAQFPY